MSNGDIETAMSIYNPPGINHNGVSDTAHLSLLLINDGQNLGEMNFAAMMEDLASSGAIRPVLCAGIHANTDRKMDESLSGSKG